MIKSIYDFLCIWSQALCYGLFHPLQMTKQIDIAISYQKSHEGLHLLIDSTGLKFLGDKLSAMSFDSQVNEVHARVIVLNKFTKLGRPHSQVVT